MKKFVLVCLFVLSSITSAQEVNGKVNRVIDGDTISIKTKSGEIHVRLTLIDAPEKDQSGGKEAKEFLENILKDKEITFNLEEKDDFGRVLSPVKVGNKIAHKEILKAGHAWVYRKYTQDNELLALEREARKSKFGLWKSSGLIPPWDWRQSK